MAGGMVLTLLSVNSIKLLVFVAVINGVLAAPFLIITMLVSSSRRIMGDYTNERVASTLGWLSVAVMSAAAVALFATSL